MQTTEGGTIKQEVNDELEIDLNSVDSSILPVYEIKPENEEQETKYELYNCDYSSFKQEENSYRELDLKVYDPSLAETGSMSLAQEKKTEVSRRLNLRKMVPPDEQLHESSKFSYLSDDKSRAVNHIGNLTVEKPYLKCSQCIYSTRRKKDLEINLRIHSGKKPLKCNECGYPAATKSHLTHHLHTHTGEKPFKCDQCSYSSAYRSALTRHRRIHTGEKPFKCDQCSYSAAIKTNLTRHLRTHTGEKPFKCDKCSYSASQKVQLKRHLKAHTQQNTTKVNVPAQTLKDAQKDYLSSSTVVEDKSEDPIFVKPLPYVRPLFPVNPCTSSARNHLLPVPSCSSVQDISDLNSTANFTTNLQTDVSNLPPPRVIPMFWE